MKILINKYLTDSISDDELKALRNWLENPKNREQFKTMVRTNQKLDYAYRPVNVDKAYQHILEATSKKQRKKYVGYRTVLKYAAAIVILISSSIGLYTLLRAEGIGNLDTGTEINTQVTLELEDGSLQILDENRETTITNSEGHKVVNQEYNKLKYDIDQTTRGELVYNQLTVPYGKRFDIELADGTVVYLNAGTKLRYPRVFTDPKRREVYLDGEALFSVKENADRPFIVHTEKMNVRVLGTKFNVSSYKDENNTSAVLAEGSVGVYRPTESFDEEKSIIISPRQQAVIHEKEFTVREVNVRKHIAWVEGKLYFVNDRFSDIVKELERHYNIKIQNNYPELNNTRYTGTFESETIEKVLNTFKRNTQFDYRKEKDQITIEPSPQPL